MKKGEFAAMRFTIFLILATVMIFVLGGMSAAQAPDAAPRGDAENGKEIFATYGCYSCHGYAAHGGPGGRIGPSPYAFAGFSAYVRQPDGVMPLYTSRVVTDQELADIYAFLQSLPRPVPADSIPLLNN
jgi:mono/diheme cytochrome c family protein